MSELLEGFFKLGKNLLPLFFIIFLGSVGYHIIEHWTWFDSLYMTVITLTTIGYQETHTLSVDGKIFTILLIFLGLGNFAYVIRNLSLEFLNPFVSGILKESRMHKKTDGRIQSNPGANYVFAEKDQLVMIAEKDEMDKLQLQYAKN